LDDFTWAKNTLRVDTPGHLQAQGVNVFFAPNISPSTKVVNLGTGQIDTFQPDEHRPETGYYADFDSLARYLEERDLTWHETEGQVFVERVPA